MRLSEFHLLAIDDYHSISTSKNKHEYQPTFHDGVENRIEFLEKSDGGHTVYERMVQGEHKRTLTLLDGPIRPLHFAQVVTPSKTFLIVLLNVQGNIQ